MTDDSKPREWDGAAIWQMMEYGATGPNLFVEYSAYDAITKERDELAEQLKSHNKLLEVSAQVVKERDELKAERDHSVEKHLEIAVLLVKRIEERDELAKKFPALLEQTLLIRQDILNERDSALGLLREIIAYFDKSLKHYGGGQYRLTTSDAFERARVLLGFGRSAGESK